MITMEVEVLVLISISCQLLLYIRNTNHGESLGLLHLKTKSEVLVLLGARIQLQGPHSGSSFSVLKGTTSYSNAFYWTHYKIQIPFYYNPMFQFILFEVYNSIIFLFFLICKEHKTLPALRKNSPSAWIRVITAL